MREIFTRFKAGDIVRNRVTQQIGKITGMEPVEPYPRPKHGCVVPYYNAIVGNEVVVFENYQDLELVEASVVHDDELVGHHGLPLLEAG